jgi:hypothetical protein
MNDALPEPSGTQNDVGLGQLIGGGLALKGVQSQVAQNSLRATMPELAEPLLRGARVAETGIGVSEAAMGLRTPRRCWREAFWEWLRWTNWNEACTRRNP